MSIIRKSYFSMCLIAFMGLTTQSTVADEKSDRFSGLFKKNLSRDCFIESQRDKDSQFDEKDVIKIADIELLTQKAIHECKNELYEAEKELTIWGLETLYIRSTRLSAAYSIVKEVNTKISNHEEVDCLSLLKGLSAMCPNTMRSIHNTVAPL